MTRYAIDKACRGGSDVVRTKKQKRKKPTARKLAKIYADQWCRAYAKKRWKSCVTCGATPPLDWAHLLTSYNESTRWDIFNIACQCRKCNTIHEYRAERMTLWFLQSYSQQAYEDLVFRHNKAAHFKTQDLLDIGNRYRLLVEG